MDTGPGRARGGKVAIDRCDGDQDDRKRKDIPEEKLMGCHGKEVDAADAEQSLVLF